MTRLSRDLIALTFFSQRRYRFSCILSEVSETSSVIEGSGGNVAVVVVVVTALVSPVAVPMVSELPVAVRVASRSMYSHTCSYLAWSRMLANHRGQSADDRRIA